MIDVLPRHLKIIKKTLHKYVPKCEIRVFDSRINGSAKKYSDLDLAIIGEGNLSKDILYSLKEDFQKSDLPFRIDILDWNVISQEFQSVITKKYEIINQDI